MPKIPPLEQEESAPIPTPVSSEPHPLLRPFIFHGLSFSISGKQANAEYCPICNKEEKFTVNLDSTMWRCWKCGKTGNAKSFLDQLWEFGCSTPPKKLMEFAQSRKLLSPDTLQEWGVRFSGRDEWVVPAFDQTGKMANLYRYRLNKEHKKRTLFATPTFNQGIFGRHLFDPTKPDVWIVEGCWDGMALWELLRLYKRDEDGGLVRTGSKAASLAATTAILAVPGCNVFREEWCSLLSGKNVTIMFHNDHPRQLAAGGVSLAGYHGTKRVVGILRACEHPPESVSYLCWGDEGYDPSLPDGYDARDHVSTGTDRGEQLATFLSRVQEAPDEWTVAKSSHHSAGLEPIPCEDWNTLLNAWKLALRWRTVIGDVLATMLAVSASTSQKGDQLFLQVIGDAGSAKTRLCDGLLVSKKCYALEHLTGFHSGFKKFGEDEDYSLLARINHKTLITPEADVMMSSPKFDELMAQQRRIFDGSSGASYKNRKEDLRYEGLRTPWIMAGTPALLDKDQSRLGDRFLKVLIDPPPEDVKRSIIERVGYTAIRSVMETCNGDKTIVEENLLNAYRLTGGYVDYLRANAGELLSRIQIDEERVVEFCATQAEFTADLRARPNTDKRKQEEHDTKEMPTRLTHQFVRLAICLAVVLNKSEVDSEVLRIVRKVGVDTARGKTFDIAKMVYPSKDDGETSARIAHFINTTEEKALTYLRFLDKIDVLEKFLYKPFETMVSTTFKWRLTPRFRQLFREVIFTNA